MAKLGRKTRVPQEAGTTTHTDINGILWSDRSTLNPVGYFVYDKAYDPERKERKQKRIAENAIRSAQRKATKRIRNGRPY